MGRKRDIDDWPPEAEKFPWISDTGRRITPEVQPFWKWIWSFIAG